MLRAPKARAEIFPPPHLLNRGYAPALCAVVEWKLGRREGDCREPEEGGRLGTSRHAR